MVVHFLLALCVSSVEFRNLRQGLGGGCLHFQFAGLP